MAYKQDYKIKNKSYFEFSLCKSADWISNLRYLKSSRFYIYVMLYLYYEYLRMKIKGSNVFWNQWALY